MNVQSLWDGFMEFAGLVLTWPVSVFAIAVVYRKELIDLLRRISRVGFGTFSADLQKDVSREESLQKEEGIKPKDYKMKYLEGQIVPNTRIVLLQIYNQNGMSKWWLENQAPVPASSSEHRAERDAMINALVGNGLITHQANERYVITELGKEFLQHLTLIK